MKRTLTVLALAAGVVMPAAMAAAPAGMPNGYLVDQNGQTLYFYSLDSHITSNCEGACATRMRPVLATANSVGYGPYDVMPRRDGTWQWAWRRHPLYTYSGDSGPRQRNGDGMEDKWHIVTSFWP